MKKITDMTSKSIKIRDLKDGDIIRFNNEFYIKTDHYDPHPNYNHIAWLVRLKDGYIMSVDRDDPVYNNNLLDIEIIVKNRR